MLVDLSNRFNHEALKDPTSPQRKAPAAAARSCRCLKTSTLANNIPKLAIGTTTTTLMIIRQEDITRHDERR